MIALIYSVSTPPTVTLLTPLSLTSSRHLLSIVYLFDEFMFAYMLKG